MLESLQVGTHFPIVEGSKRQRIQSFDKLVDVCLGYEGRRYKKTEDDCAKEFHGRFLRDSIEVWDLAHAAFGSTTVRGWKYSERDEEHRARVAL